MAKFTTQGMTVAVNNGVGNVNIAHVESVSFGGGEAEEYDVTSLASTSKEILTGFSDNGDVTFNLFLDPADTGQTYVRGEAYNTNTRPFLIRLPASSGGNNISFNVALKSFVPNFERGAAKATLTGKISGAITWA